MKTEEVIAKLKEIAPKVIKMINDNSELINPRTPAFQIADDIGDSIDLFIETKYLHTTTYHTDKLKTLFKVDNVEFINNKKLSGKDEFNLWCIPIAPSQNSSEAKHGN